ncbi:hypothetical protein C3F00_045300, partial [Pseudomonas sp. MWU13-2860]
ELRHALDGEVAAVGKRLAANLAGPMWNFDNTQGRRVVEAEMSMAALSGVFVRDANGAAFAGYRRDAGGALLSGGAPPPEADLTQGFPIVFHDGAGTRQVGKLTLQVSTDGIRQQLRAVLWRVAAEIPLRDLAPPLPLSLFLRRLLQTTRHE